MDMIAFGLEMPAVIPLATESSEAPILSTRDGVIARIPTGNAVACWDRQRRVYPRARGRSPLWSGKLRYEFLSRATDHFLKSQRLFRDGVIRNM
jgi:hypothetical protein